MNRALKFRRKLWGIGAFVIAILGFAFFLALRSASQAESLFDWSVHAKEVLDKISQARFGRSRLMNQLWAYRVTRNPALPPRFREDMESLRQNMGALRELTTDNPKQRQILEELTPLIAEQLVLLQGAMDDAIQGNTAPADSSTWSLPFQPSDHVRDLFNTMEKDERTLVALRSAAVHVNVDRTYTVLLVAGALTAIILFAAVYLVQREILLRARVETGLRRAQEMLGMKFEGQRAELGHVLEDLHAQIRARAQAEQEVQQLNADLGRRVRQRTAELEDMNRELEAFSYSVSHDLRAPLRHLDGFSRILQQTYGQQLPDGAQHYLERIRGAAKHMSDLVEDLLQLARVGRHMTQRELQPLRALVDEARKEVEPECVERDIRWEIGKLAELDVDAGLFRLVFTNLFSNAVKFTRDRQVATIEVGSFDGNGMSVIFVRDNGAGFDPHHADKLFGVFQRLHRQDEFEGTGIGLATVHRIVQKHGGRVWAESELNQGACFYFSVPTRSPATTEERNEPIGAEV
jgi:signal transduction histidine kinase